MHDWGVTEADLTDDLPEDLKDAWERLRETATEFGPQRVYASHHCIMFSKKVCYFFVRPKPKYLELCIFLGRPIKAPQVRKVYNGSPTKYASIVRVTHRDEVEAPLTDWLREAYETHDSLLARPRATRRQSRHSGRRRTPSRTRARSTERAGRHK